MFTVPCLDRRYRMSVLVLFVICSFLISRPSRRHQQTQKDWQPVAGSKFPFSVYSAYAFIKGPSPPSQVTIIATGSTHYHDPVRCKFYFTGDPKLSSNSRTRWTPGTSTLTMLPSSIAYGGVFVRCPLPRMDDAVPRYVSVVVDKNATEAVEVTNILPINYKDESPNNEYQFTFSVCLKPTYRFDDFFHFLEWVEFHKMMGVEHFTMFNISIGPDVSCILNDLMERNLFDVFPWHNNPVNDTLEPQVGTCVISAAHNICLHKHRGRFSKYMVSVDLDEYIMPRLNTTRNYPELINYLNLKNPKKKIAEYRFSNAFFQRSQGPDPQISERCGAFKDKPLYYSVCQQSFMMSKVKRKDFNGFHERTKYIMKPEAVKETETHWVRTFEDGFERIDVPEEIAFMRHYRYLDANFISPPAYPQPDRVPLEMGAELVNNLGKQLKYFMNKCNLNISKIK